MGIKEGEETNKPSRDDNKIEKPSGPEEKTDDSSEEEEQQPT